MVTCRMYAPKEYEWGSIIYYCSILVIHIFTHVWLSLRCLSAICSQREKRKKERCHKSRLFGHIRSLDDNVIKTAERLLTCKEVQLECERKDKSAYHKIFVACVKINLCVPFSSFDSMCLPCSGHNFKQHRHTKAHIQTMLKYEILQKHRQKYDRNDILYDNRMYQLLLIN